MTAKTYTAWATDNDQSAVIGCDPEGILIQESIDDEGQQVYTGVDIELDGPTPDADAMDEVLRAAGWTRVSEWDTVSGQHIAQVERRTTVCTVHDEINVPVGTFLSTIGNAWHQGRRQSRETSAGWRDILYVKDGAETVDTIIVEPSEDPEPYVAALAAAGWTVTGQDAAARWLVVRSEK